MKTNNAIAINTMLVDHDRDGIFIQLEGWVFVHKPHQRTTSRTSIIFLKVTFPIGLQLAVTQNAQRASVLLCCLFKLKSYEVLIHPIYCNSWYTYNT